MSRQRNRLHPAKTSHVNFTNPNEKTELAELINGIKQYQDEEYKSMRADFERVEQLIAQDTDKKRSLLETRDATQSLPIVDRLQITAPITENQPQLVAQSGNTEVVANHNQYVKWTLMFFLMLFFGAMIKIRFADDVTCFLDFLRMK